MTRALSAAMLALAAAGCTPPGKPKPVPDDGLPVKDLEFSSLYSKYCVGCHGADGARGPAPPLNDPLFLHIVPDKALREVIANGRPGTPMPPFDQARGGLLIEKQIEVLASGMKAAWGKGAVPPNPPPYALAAGGDASRGAALFATACSGCHGSRGEGGTYNGRAVGSINDPAFLALSSDQLLRRLVITGRPDLDMPNYADRAGRPPSYKPLSAGDADDLTAYLISWRK